MAKKYTLMNKEAIDELCKAVRESHSVSEAIDDDNLATNSTFSSVKIDNLIKVNKAENKEYTDKKIDESISGTIDDTLSDTSTNPVQNKVIKSYVDNSLANIQTALNSKANSADVYTKSETDTKITEKVAEIVAGAPADFDTLKEMSDWIANHEGSAAAMNAAINTNSTNISNLQAEIGDIENETIRADDADSEGKCQLYKTVNGERVNVEPKVSGGGLTTNYAEFAARVACWDFPDGVMVIPDGITSIGDYAFCAGTSNGGSSKYILIKSITIPDSVMSIGDSAFEKCTSLASVTIGNSVTSIGKYAFSGCTSLASVTIPDRVTSIGGAAFYGCTSLASITIPDSVTSMGGSTFYDCTSLASVTIPDRVTSIGYRDFYNCTSLKSITIPDSVTSIGKEAFKGCTSLADIYYTGTEEQWNAITKGDSWNSGMSSNVSGGTIIHYNYVPE